MGCDELTLVPVDTKGISTCAACGSVEVFSRLPTIVLCGASGSGKSTLVRPLQERLRDHVVIDTDVLLGRWTEDWEAHFELVIRMAAAIAGNGRPVVLSASATPERLETRLSRDLLGQIIYIAVDCTPEERQRRLAARPAWRTWNASRAAEANRFATELRAACDISIDTTGRTITEVADEVASIITARTTPTA